MGINKSITSLKQQARGLLLGNYRKAISLLLASNLMISTLTLLIGGSAGFSVISLTIDYLVSFILTLLGCILQVGQYSFYLKLVCRQETQFKNLFEGFYLYPDKTLLSQFLIHLFTLLCLTPGLVLFIFSYFSFIEISGIIILCILVIGAVLSLWIKLSFSQCYFLLLDFPKLSALELMKRSRELMKGHKKRLFLLYLSFLPMTILCLFSFGIGFLFVTPYRFMTETFFYLDLVQNQ